MIRKKIIGGLLGKAIGGTLGQPFEGCSGPLTLSFYDPVPTEMLPNDDLDLQILWLCSIANRWQGVLSYANFAQTWRESMHFNFDEYGVATRNLEMGVLPPWSGAYDNAFTDGLGAAIRSELWAFLAPGNPEKAVQYAEYDASIDHAGDGVYAELFWSALESMAFTESSIPNLITHALRFVPAQSRFAAVILDTVRWCGESQNAPDIRKKIIAKYGSPNMTDCVMNAGFTVMALLLGRGDFGKTICLAVNCGRDTDCTGATAGAIMGILNPDGVGEEWRAPIGHNLVLSKEISGITPPATLEELADVILAWQDKIVCGELRAPEPEWARYAITAKTGISEPNACGDFTRSPLEVPQMHEVQLPGNLLNVDFKRVPHDAFVVYEIPVAVPVAGDYVLVVAAQSKCMVHWDGTLILAQACGNFVPAPHRAHVNQHKTLALEAGTHTLRIAVAPQTEDTPSTPLLFALTDTRYHWVAGAFRHNQSGINEK